MQTSASPFSRLITVTALVFGSVLPGLVSTPVYSDTQAIYPATSSNHCMPFTESGLYREPAKSIAADPSNWTSHIENAADGDEILLQDGLYPLEQYSVVINAAITLRSASGNSDSVVIEGQGYSENAEALMIMANDVHIADLTIKNTRDHGITIQEDYARPVIYNVNLIDIGTQHIKGNRPGPNGTIACSNIGYSTPVSKGDYNSAIDIHRAVEWTIRDNTIYNIYGDGSGCVVDSDCGSMWPGGEPALLLWRDSKDNTVERNTIIDSYRAIALGLDTPYSGGVVKDNFICHSETGKDGINGFISGDAGISLSGASDVTVTGNTIALAGDYAGQIEIRDGTGIQLENNIMSKPVWDRGNAEFVETGNIITADFTGISCTQPETLLIATATEELSDDKINNSAVAAMQTEPLPVTPLPVASLDAEHAATTTKTQDESVPDHTVSLSEDALAHRALLLDIREERLLAMEERMLATEERLKAKEERLLFQEQRLILESRLERLEQLLQASEQQLLEQSE